MRLSSMASEFLTKTCIVWVVWLSLIYVVHSRKTPTPDRQYPSLNSYLNSKQIEKGDLFETPNGLMIIAVDQCKLVLFPKVSRFSSFFQLVNIQLPTLPGSDKYTHALKVSPDPNFKYGSARAVAMAKRLQNKVLPHQAWFCNKGHWQMYVLYGVAQTEGCSRHCPLAQPLDGVTAEDIPCFQFKDRRGKVHYFPTWKEHAKNLEENEESVDCGCCRWHPGHDCHPKNRN